MSLKVAKPLDEVLEKEWDAQLFRGGKRPGLAPMLGWTLSYHTMRSKGSRAGFPDRVLVHGGRLIFAELKREKGVATPLTDEQRRWLDALAGAGCECYLWRPSDFEEIARVLSKRWVLGFGIPSRYLTHESEPFWTPNSLWIPECGRFDGT
jgi:hypothetical protein